MPDGSWIRRGPGETLQQAIDRATPTRTSALLEVVSPQIAAAASYINSVLTPTKVTTMHTVDVEDSDDELESEDTDEIAAANSIEGITDIPPEQLEAMIQALSNQLKKSGKPPASSARPFPRKKKADDHAPSSSTAATASAPRHSTSTNSTPPSMNPVPAPTLKPTIPQTVVPQVRFSDPKDKSKEPQGPDFHYRAPIEDKADAKQVYDRILGASVPVTVQELLSLAPDLRKQAKESTTTKRVKAAAYVGIDPVSTLFNSLDACDCHQGLLVAKESHALRSIIPIIDGHLPVECILDSGCQIIGMSKAVWMALSKEINLKHTVSMQSANGTVDRSLGIIENLSFCFGTVELQLQVHVIDDPAYDILLGRPFDVLTESSVKNYRNEDQTLTITDPNNPRHVAMMQTHPCGQAKHHTEQVPPAHRREGF